jgi:hypothetical protein
MPRKRLTRKEINEGLAQVPVEEILLGRSRSHGVALTAKQLKFAEELAKGETKAGAYRKAYNTQASPAHQSLEGQRLAKHPIISQQVEAIKLALEAEKYATPLHLRALVIQRLTEKALDPDVNHAQQLRALELLGKVTEIAAFTERRETVHVHDAQAMKEKLLHSLRLAVQADAQDADYTDAESLLAELGDQATVDAAEPDPTPDATQPGETPPPATPLILSDAGGDTTHSNPHKGSTDRNAVTLDDRNSDTLDRNSVTLEGATVTQVTVGGGGIELLDDKDRESI